MTAGAIYLDNHSTTPVDPAVLLEQEPYFSESCGNAASRTHVYGWRAAEAVDEARSCAARLIGGRASDLVFTSGATESNNLAILGVARAAGLGGHLIATAAEHRAALDPARALQADGFDVTVLPVDRDAGVGADRVADAIRPDTVLVSVIHANNEVGTINPIAEIGAVCREREVLFHTDATQTVGRIPIDVSKLPVDLMSFSAHKMYGPKGVGALYVRHETVQGRIRPLMYGGGHERGLRSGTLPVPLIVGFGKACELCEGQMEEESRRIGRLRDRLWERLQAEIPDVARNGDPANGLPGNLNVSFLGVPSEAFLVKLRDVVAVSAGSACTSANPEPSHVLRAMGLSSDRIESAIRFGIGRFNTYQEIEYVANAVRDAVAELRR